jgi:hypothetical protein
MKTTGRTGRNRANRKRLFLVPLLVLALITAYSNCNGGFTPANYAPSSASNSSLGPSGYLGLNGMSVSIGGQGTAPSLLPNRPVVSVTICVPNTTNCVEIPNLLLDTGSQGLRVYLSALPSGFNTNLQWYGMSECTLFGDNSIMWGPVALAIIRMGQESTSQPVPFQIVASDYADGGATCLSTVTSELTSLNEYDANNPPFLLSPLANYNGIIGVNQIIQDCPWCADDAENGTYYTCTGTTCTNQAAALNQQVANPIAYMPADNNGITVQFPAAPASGISSEPLSGMAYLGIGTQPNNTPAGSVVMLSLDLNENDTCYTDITTKWNGASICSFLDTGSNGYVFPNVTANALPTDQNDVFTPGSPMTFSAINVGNNGTQAAASFTVGNVDPYLGSYPVLAQFASDDPNGQLNGQFDWGLPFFLGRTVYLGYQGAQTVLGAGPFYAY